MSKWQEYSDKFQTITPREQYLILFTGLIAIIFITFSLFIDATMIKTNDLNDKSQRLASDNKSTRASIAIFEGALNEDPNKPLHKQISAYQKEIKKIDEQLLLLTSELIDPIQMRFALIDMLKVQRGVSLISFELLGAKPIMHKEGELVGVDVEENTESNIEDAELASHMYLYQHGIKLRLTGKYFQLRDYLTQLEAMPWKFFWQDFKYTTQEYPLGELEIEMYSLSTNKEFIGV